MIHHLGFKMVIAIGPNVLVLLLCSPCLTQLLASGQLSVFASWLMNKHGTGWMNGTTEGLYCPQLIF